MNIRRLALAGLVCAFACTRPAPRAGGPNVVTITATDYAFGVPDTIPAGLTTFRLANQGKELHHASLVRLGQGKTVADFQAGLEAAMKKEMAFELAFSRAGGLLIAGADPTGNGGALPGFADQRGVGLLVEAGFSPAEALRIASANGMSRTTLTQTSSSMPSSSMRRFNAARAELTRTLEAAAENDADPGPE